MRDTTKRRIFGQLPTKTFTTPVGLGGGAFLDASLESRLGRGFRKKLWGKREPRASTVTGRGFAIKYSVSGSPGQAAPSLILVQHHRHIHHLRIEGIAKTAHQTLNSVQIYHLFAGAHTVVRLACSQDDNTAAVVGSKKTETGDARTCRWTRRTREPRQTGRCGRSWCPPG